MKRGEIRLVDFEPASGSETNKRRPAVIVSNDGMNEAASRTGRGVVTVVPVTSNAKHVRAFQVLLPAGSGGLRVDSKVQAEQVRSIATERIGELLGQLSPVTLRQVDDALRTHLGL